MEVILGGGFEESTYSNPVADYLTTSSNKAEAESTVRLICAGSEVVLKSVKSTNQYEILSLIDLPQGQYLLEIVDALTKTRLIEKIKKL